MKTFIAWLGLGMAVAGCAEARQAPVRTDAGPPESLVTVELTRGIVAAVGETVVFHDAAGEPLFETTTDAFGVATFAPGAATVTVTLVMRRPSGRVDISSREGLVAGDRLRLPLRPDANAEPGFEVRFPGTVPGAIYYQASSACAHGNDSSEDASPVDASYCDAPFQHVIGLALDATYQPIAFSAARDLPARVERLTLPAWRTDFPRPPVVTTTAPGVGELKAGVGEPSRGWVGDYPIEGTAVYSVFAQGVTLGGDGQPVTHRVETREQTMPSEVTLRAEDLRAPLSNLQVTSRDGRPTFGWDGSPPPRTSHIWLGVSYGVGEAQALWTFRVVPRADGAVPFPRLPSSAESVAPPERNVRWFAWLNDESWHDGYQWISDTEWPLDGKLVFTSVSGEL